MKVAHPFPADLPPSPPGMSRPDLVAKDPALQAAVRARDAHTAAYHRAYTAHAVHRLLTESPPRPVPMPAPDAPEKKRVALAKKAIEQASEAQVEVGALGPIFARHTGAVAASHPEGGAALKAAQQEAARRLGVAAAVARQHVEALPPELRAKAGRLLDRALRESLAVPVVLQGTDWSCGSAALQAVLDFHGVRVDNARLRQALGTDPDDGTQPEALVRLVQELGLPYEVRDGATLDDLAHAIQHGAPCICCVQAGGGGHWVCAVGLEADGVRIVDPVRGERTVPAADWLRDWWDTAGGKRYDCWALAVGPPGLREEVDASGHAHASDGRFGTVAGSHNAPAAKLPHARDGKGNEPNPAVSDGARPHLEAAEAQALTYYSGGGYVSLNQTLRTGNAPSGKNADTHAALQAAFAKAKPLVKPVVVVRGLQLDDPAAKKKFLEAAVAAQKGKKLMQLGGYTSTSTDPHTGFVGDIKFELTCTHGLDVKPYAMSPRESEFLLDNNTRFRVKSVVPHKNGRSWLIKAEQVTGG